MNDELGLNLNSVDTARVIVPNERPKTEFNKIAVIGEAPGAEEEQNRRPFVGASGRILRNIMTNAGIPSSAAYIGNVTPYRPPNNNIKRFEWHGPEIQDGLEQLKADLKEFRPNVVVLLGATAMRAAGRSEAVSSYRGTLFQCVDVNSPFFGMKCLATVHPAAIMRQWSLMPLFRFDMQRAAEESKSPELNLPQREFELDLTVDECIDRLENIGPDQWTALDIEGGVETGVKCISFSTDPSRGFLVPFNKFSVDDEVRLVAALKKFLAGPTPKVLQNSLYDNFVLVWEYRCLIRNVVWDTMLSGWELYPELPKALGTQASLYTKEPYYKFERKSGDIRTFHEYCCKDSAVTLEIALAQRKMLKGDSLKHFQFNMDMLQILLYMELRGMRYDKEEAKRLHGVTMVKLKEVQSRLNARRGKALNVNSPKQMCEFLYDELGFPVQHPKEGNAYNRSKRTSGFGAILTLMKKFDDSVLRDITTWRKIEKIRQALEYTTDPDGRIRCSYNVVGTETGRLNCYSSPTGSGANLQTVTKKLRCLYLADEDHYFFGFDLEGADGWTVAAHCAALGDDTMLRDYQAGIKPAKIIALMHLHGAEVQGWDRDKLREAAGPIGKTDESAMLYFACKRVQHGTNYLLGERTMSQQILQDSYKLLGQALHLRPAECSLLQSLYLQRYPGVRMWQKKIIKQLETTGELKSASGATRKFFGRRGDNQTQREAVAHEPQANTTYATNMVAWRMWNDPENRREDGSLIVEPLHQVHDELCGQFPKDKVDFALSKIKQWFNNPLTIAGIELVIPFDGGYGRSWGEREHQIEL